MCLINFRVTGTVPLQRLLEHTGQCVSEPFPDVTKEVHIVLPFYVQSAHEICWVRVPIFVHLSRLSPSPLLSFKLKANDL